MRKEHVMKRIWQFVKDDRGTETVEWGIVAGLLVVGLVALFSSIGTWVNDKITTLDNDLAGTD